MRLAKLVLGMLLMFFAGALVLPLAHALDDAILAVVNDEVITVKDLREYMKGIYSQLKIEGRSPQEIDDVMSEYEKKGIDQLIEDRLVLSAADKNNVVIRPQAVDERLEEIKKRYASYEEFLRAIRTEGMTITDIRKKIENQIKGQVMVNNEVRSKIYIHPQEVTERFNANASKYRTEARVYVDTIFVKSAFGKEEARKKIENAQAALKRGLDFKDAVSQFSELPPVGEVTEEQLRPEFKQVVDNMKIGDVSDILEVPNGFYIIKLEGRVIASVATLKDVKDSIYQELFQEKFRERFKTWTDGLRKKAYVEIKN